MSKSKSKAKRWQEAVTNAREKFDLANDACQELQDALSELADIQSEYQDQYDNLSERGQEGPTGERLSEIIELDFDLEVDLDEIQSVLDEADEVEA